VILIIIIIVSYNLNNILTHRTVQLSPPFIAVFSGLFERSRGA
jgi:hypothetical protein